MKSLNRFQFIGNLTKDTELKSKPEQTPLAVFDIAVNGSYTDQRSNEVKEYTDYFQIKVWGKAAESAIKHLGKGSQVFVEGIIRNTQYTVGDQKRYGTDYIAEKIQYLNTKEPSASGNEN
ncbi:MULTISPECIES: single-stranded DNA-binding protein [Enterobacteriaceae]|uniref:single-stranded DNA-binding protein n=1 Tax=Enterobacteriaceae TaxID=543 RepID=UPI00066D1230|nr:MULTISPECIES: single-stranded DNA-binding protein [Enterobacteriaceae]EAT2030353.1 single-stranded DNA-binding protein [Salmonella enterica]EKZ9716343.1 single-stranded DNA-binding protein [Klebsiella pneumoniae]EAX4489597.1 single-stranded DNA-binding protein [Salmonella enterica]KMV54313.1 single-stranded DNA-binding protein [Escherichia coli]MBD5662472.1 single-stranded DNA-binding protein [Citrobacter freundii]